MLSIWMLKPDTKKRKLDRPKLISLNAYKLNLLFLHLIHWLFIFERTPEMCIRWFITRIFFYFDYTFLCLSFSFFKMWSIALVENQWYKACLSCQVVLGQMPKEMIKNDKCEISTMILRKNYTHSVYTNCVTQCRLCNMLST